MYPTVDASGVVQESVRARRPLDGRVDRRVTPLSVVSTAIRERVLPAAFALLLGAIGFSVLQTWPAPTLGTRARARPRRLGLALSAGTISPLVIQLAATLIAVT
jgi:hypothetical protein